MKQESITPNSMEQKNNSTRSTTLVLRNFVRTFLVCAAFWLVPSIAKADTPIPTSIVSSYDAILHRLTLTVHWSWPSSANDKYVTAAVFADLNGDAISPTYLDNPATYTSGGNPFPAGLSARDEFLGQLAISTIEGSATSSLYPAIIDHTDNGIAAQHGYGPNDPRVLFPYGTTAASTVGTSGTFTMTFDNVTVSPSKICVVMYDVHTGNLSNLSGDHSPRSAGPNENDDNSVEKGNSQGTVTCTGLIDLRCQIDKTEASCQSQATITASYNAWLNSVTATGCNGVLTNNSTGAPSACGGSKTVTWTYTQNGCPNQNPVTTCSATFTVIADNTPPVITCPSGANLGCNPNGVPAAGTATATDNCTPSNNIIFTNSLGPVVVNGNQRSQTRTYTATDACGNSASCGQVFTWTICPRDLTPNITAIPNVMTGPTDFAVTVRTSELLGAATDGSQIVIRIPRDPKVSFVWNPAATMIGFTSVNNSVWIFDNTDPFVYIFRANIIIAGNGFSTFGFDAHFNPGQTQGKYPLTASLQSGSGGENNFGNNNDAESIDFFIN